MDRKMLSRRSFLSKAALFAGATTLAACQPQVVKETVVVEKEVEKVVKETVIIEGTPQVIEKVVKETVVVEVEKEPVKAQSTGVVNWLGPIVPPYRYEWVTTVLLDWWKDVNPDLKIEVEQASSWPDTEEKVLVRYAGGGGPDLVQTGETGAVTEFAYRKIYASLNPFLEADPEIGPELFYVAPMKAGQFEGETYAMPQDAICEAFFYNKAHFEAAGIEEAPATHADLAEYAKALTELDDVDFGLGLNPSSWGTFACYLYSNGGKFMDDECSRVFLGDETSVDTLKWMMTQVDAGVATKHGGSASINNGKVSMVDSVPWIVGWTKNYAPEIYESLGATIMPRRKGGNTAWGWAHYESILSNSKNKEGAWEFLSWMLSEEIDLPYHDNLNFLPCQPRTYEKEPFSTHWAWTAFAQQLTKAQTMPLCVAWREISTDAMVPELEAAWIGEKNPEEALATAKTKAEEILG